jgi:hypothetical protein
MYAHEECDMEKEKEDGWRGKQRGTTSQERINTTMRLTADMVTIETVDPGCSWITLNGDL